MFMRLLYDCDLNLNIVIATFQKVASMMSGNSQIVNEDHLKVGTMVITGSCDHRSCDL